MSNAFAIASVTQVLLGMLENISQEYYNDISAALGVIPTFSATAPNRIVSTSNENPGVNLFLYRVAPNPGWCNRDYPSLDNNGRRIGNPPLALDLYYLVSAYGKKDLDADLILGYAAQVFHENPVINREIIPGYLEKYKVKNVLERNIFERTLLESQMEQIKISPVTLSTEEISKLWTAFQAPCRSSIAYLVSVVLIESRKSVRSNLPVLTRGEFDKGLKRDEGIHLSPSLDFPVLSGIHPPANQISAKPGDTVVLSGSGLGSGVVTVECQHRRQDRILTPGLVGQPSDTTISFGIPANPYDSNGLLLWPAGYYSVLVTIMKNGKILKTNTLPMAIAPAAKEIADNPSASRSGDTLTVTMTCLQAVLPAQDVSIVIRDREFIADIRKITTDSLTFTEIIPSTDLPQDSHYYRIRVDGVESHLIDRTKNPPIFLDSQKVFIP